MAELLIRAKAHWMDSLTAAQVKKLTPEELVSYKARSQIGDIIVVRPDGYEWGREECLPNFIVVKLPGVSVEEAKKYEESLSDSTDPEKPILLKVRKYQVLPATVSVNVALGINVKEVNPDEPAGTVNPKNETTAFKASIIDKSKVVEVVK